MENMSEAIVFISAQTGKITEVNAAALALLGRSSDAVLQSQLVDFFEGRKRGDLVETLAS